MLIPLLTLLAAAPTNDTLRLLVVTDDTVAHAALVHGATLGADEAAHTGALFGTTVVLRVVAAIDSAAAWRAVTDADGGRAPSLVVAAGPAAVCDAAAAATRRHSIPLLDAGCASSAAADASTPATNVFHLGRVADAAADSARLELWHWTLEKFGGEQLNQRYERRFHEHMTSAAWEGWLATKIALDLALHAHSGKGPAMLARLRDPHAQFDGQKGRPLHFDATHRLVQPLYRVTGGGDGERVVGEVTP